MMGWKEVAMSYFMHSVYCILLIYCHGIFYGVTEGNSGQNLS